MTTDKIEYKPLPDMATFCLDTPLYQAIPYTIDNLGELNTIKNFDDHFDCYCLDCKQMSVFHSQIRSISHQPFEYYANVRNVVFRHSFACTRDNAHVIYFEFILHDNTIIKIGQYPSIADIATIDIQKYRKVLGKEQYAEFNRAIGLTTHGIGIGAFVYLRRIFENLIEEVHQTQKAVTGWDEATYQRSRMEERITILKDFLPSFLVEHKALYSILSKGIHELHENECLSAFPITKLGIELILDEKLEKLARETKIKQASSDIATLTQKIKSK